MTSSLIKVSPAELAAKSAEIKAASQYMESRLQEINADFNALQAAWEGVAGEEYEARQAEWNTAGDSLKMLLATIGGAVDSSGATMAASETANRNRFAG